MASGLIPAVIAMAGFREIRLHEKEHVVFLASTITSLGETPVRGLQFDYTAGYVFPDAFTNYDTFLTLSQTFEDTGVRAYKGQAGNLQSSDVVLTATLQIHCVEASHASHVRQIRSQRANDEMIRPWITGNSASGIGAAVQASYAGEKKCIQLGIEIHNIDSFDISYDDAEAFDEILRKDELLAIVNPFIV